MRQKIKNVIPNSFTSLKTIIKRDKTVFIIGMAFVFLGLLLSLSGISDYVSNNSNALSIIGEIKENTFNYVTFELKLILYPIIILGIAYLLSCNFFIFLLSYVEIVIISRFFFRCVILILCTDTIFGILSFILILLPLFCITIIGLLYFIAKIIEIISYPPCGKKFALIPYSCYWTYSKKIIIKYLKYVSLISFIYANIIVLIIFLIFNV